MTSCAAQEKTEQETSVGTPLYHNAEITVGAERIPEYLPLLKGKTVGLVVNQTSMVGESHLADTLLQHGIQIKAIFAPEHGFRGTADAGETIKDGIDTRTGIPVISLYGKNKKPTDEQFNGLNAVIFDIQDVGARFYTYISTMHYVMEAAAENDIPVVILDRPNPNGFYMDGPVLDTAYRSFVGMHPVPIVHGMTVGEYAQMINGEGWLNSEIQCDLTVITCEGYDHNKFYELPIKPSPNLPNMLSIYLYPTLCLFEGSDISVGRGTDKQFQIIGSPNLTLIGDAFFEFTPEPKPGAKYPKHQGVKCTGYDYSDTTIRTARALAIAPSVYRTVYEHHTEQNEFFTSFFDKLAGGTRLREAILNATADELIDTYHYGLKAFKPIRKKYLLYKDFE
ncbi:MAG: DUF1343 domain-containing protein [Bacteroidetes bacterium]|nr:DUF1343 domain-containing protein [Bacteroidota bacterium]